MHNCLYMGNFSDKDVLFIRWQLLLIFAKKSKTRKKKVKKSANKFPLSIMVQIFNSMPYLTPACSPI